MKNTAKNNLSYTGIVTLSQYTDKKKKIKLKQVYNAGNNPLFNFLSDCLLGDFDLARINIPTKIMLLKVDDKKEHFEKATSASFIYLLTKAEKVYSPNAGIVRYSFMISQDTLLENPFNAIGLYTDAATEEDLDNYAAYCLVDSSELRVASSSMLIVDWELIIANKDTKVN